MVSNPFSQAVRADFLASLIRGVDAQTAVVQLRKEYGSCLENRCTKRRFVLSLALAAWQTGRLYPRLMSEAVEIAREEAGEFPGDPVPDGALQRIVDTLTSPQSLPVDLSTPNLIARLEAELSHLEAERPAA